MINFNELRVTSDSSNLIIDVEVSKLSYFENIYIDKIIINTQDNYSSSGPDESNITVYDSSKDYKLVYTNAEEEVTPVLESTNRNNIYVKGNSKGVKVVLDKSDVGYSFSRKMLFIYVITKGTPAPDTPCGMDNSVHLKVIADWMPIFKASMNFIELLKDSCTIHNDFVDYILMYKALDLCIKSGNFTAAIKYWKKLSNSAIKGNYSSKCKCYGTNY